MPRSCRRTVRNCARIFAQARARKKSRKIARKSAKTSERSMKTDGSYATTARNCVTIARTPAKIGARGARIARAAAAGVGRHSPLRKRGSGRCPVPPCPLLVALVEHLERVAIPRHLPVFPGVLQALLQLVHLLLPFAVRRALVEQVEQRHVDDLAAPDDHVLVDPAGEGFAGVLLHDLGLERIVADLRLRNRADGLDLFPKLGNVLQQVALDLFVPALVELLHRLADEDLNVDRLLPDSVRRMGAEAEPVILFLRLRISQDPVGLADLLEAGLRLLIAGMEIRVVLLRQLAVNASDLLRCGVLLNPQYFVVVPHGVGDYSISRIAESRRGRYYVVEGDLMSDTPKYTNRLLQETSLYLLQHAHNPVEWYPWGEEALARAKAENKPILLSIGYSACHWCHVMERESFENPDIAKVMNEHFVNIQ